VRAVGELGGPSDAPLLAGQFESNNPGVAKAALSALEGLEPDLAARKAREVLGRPELHASTRQAMEAYLERYRRGEVGAT
jgi:HEAT repeat protein